MLSLRVITMQVNNHHLAVNLATAAGMTMGSNTVPAFLTKLWTLVEDPEYDDLICWDTTGKTFHVLDQARFAKEILPLYFKHSNIASFIRQLNMYGFRKVMTIDQGGLKYEKDDMQFQHPFFIRGEEGMLEFIKRKVPTNKEEAKVLKQDDSMSKVLVDVNQLQGRQDHMNSKLDALKRQNEALWREVASLRTKHMKQQQIVNKLVQFLMTLVGGSNRGLAGMKRKKPLMINDASQLKNPKVPKYNRQLSIDNSAPEYTVESPASENPPSFKTEAQSSTGLVIHDVTDVSPDLLNISAGSSDSHNTDTMSADALVNEVLADSKSKLSGSAQDLLPTQTISSPSHPGLENEDYFSEISSSKGEKGRKPPELSFDFSHLNHFSGLTTDVDSVQQDLDQLKELLSSTSYIDNSTLSGLFSPDVPFGGFDVPLDYAGDLGEKSDTDNAANSSNPANVIVPLIPASSSMMTPQRTYPPPYPYDCQKGPIPAVEMRRWNELIQYNPIDLPGLFDMTSDSDLNQDFNIGGDISTEVNDTLDTPQAYQLTDPLEGLTSDTLPYTTDELD
ncbi:heat shock factor protein-like [Tubulanus polymorphus]|uniref:heat shock factor protein-like n=1 Tax=Tubulanus polymorphus TaxID=672921 RepID=UPI003DA29E29